MTELNNYNLPQQEINEIKVRCFNCLQTLLKEFIERMPSNLQIFHKMKLLSPVCCLNKQQKINFAELPLQPFFYGEDLNTVENQWRKLQLVNWEEEFRGNVPNNILKFWPIVFNYVDGAGQQIFKELATIVLRLLTFPLSNAAVERVFSIMNSVKTKVRNRLKLTTLEAIIRTKIFCFNRKICCNNFTPTGHMLSLFNSNIVYANCDGEDAINENELHVIFNVTQEFFE